LITRSDFGISRAGGSMRIGWCSSTRRFSASITISRSAVACAPSFRSWRRCHSSIALNHAHSAAAPTRSMTASQEMPVNSDRPIAASASSKSVAPVKPNVAWNTWAMTAPSIPPGVSGRTPGCEWKRSASSPDEAMSTSEKPASAMMNGRRSEMIELPSSRR
jgi:hypothetical protein